MKQIMSDLIGMILSLSHIDILLYIAVVVLIILIVSLIYIIKTGEEETTTIENVETDDLKTILKKMEKNKLETVALTDFEKEQEAKAIISYDELIAKNKLGNLKYDEENIVNDEIVVKKINLDSLIEKSDEQKKTITFYNYKREEEFLKNLKALTQLLN